VKKNVTLYDYSASLYAKKKRNYKQSGGKNNCTERRVHASDFNLVFVPRCTSTPPFMAARLLIGNNLLRRFTPFSCVCAGARDYEMAEKCFMIENPEKCEPKLSGAEHVLITRP
jgi:hypothetical protein